MTDSLSNFITIATDAHGMCALSSCSIVTSTATTCGTASVTYFTASNTGSTVTLTTSTTNERLIANYCLKCMTNDVTPVAIYSAPFTMEVLIDCTNYISKSAINGPFTYTVPATPAGTFTQVLLGSSYSATTLAAKCPLSYTLKTVSPDATYTGNQVSIDSSTGKVSVDTNKLLNDNFYVQITTTAGIFLNTNSFNLVVACGPSSNTVTPAATLTNLVTW